MKTLHCEKHGRQLVTIVWGDAQFCEFCIRDALLALGVKPVHERWEDPGSPVPISDAEIGRMYKIAGEQQPK